MKVSPLSLLSTSPAAALGVTPMFAHPVLPPPPCTQLGSRHNCPSCPTARGSHFLPYKVRLRQTSRNAASAHDASQLWEPARLP